jgi:hypothetical protein
VVLDAARPILAEAGIVVVSEPPHRPDRWTPTVVGADFVRVRGDERVAVLARVPRGTS